MIVLSIKNPQNIYHELAVQLTPHIDQPQSSVSFLAEGTLENPIIVLQYPGYKAQPRGKNAKIAWANAMDFLVVPYEHGRPLAASDFAYTNLLEDFVTHKMHSEEFWRCIEKVHKTHTVSNPPSLPGIDAKIFLYALKWLWIQEDLNYMLRWNEIDSPLPYVLQNKNGKPTAKGAGRWKFYASMLLAKHGVSKEHIRKITG